MFTIESGNRYLVQWDTGQRLIIDDPTITEVHFSKGTDLAAVMQVTTEGDRRVVKVPDRCLQLPHDLAVFFVVTGPDGQSNTVHIAAIRIVRRPKPDDYVETEDEVLRWTTLTDTIGTLSDLKTMDKSCLVAAINEVLSKVGEGTIDPDAIAQAVEDYLAANPPATGEPGPPGQAATIQITGADALPAGSAPTVTEQEGSTAQARIYHLGIPAGKDGAPGKNGDPGPAGAAGGYYTPAVTQPDANTMRVSFTPSDVDMPKVEDKDVALPVGPQGPSGLADVVSLSGAELSLTLANNTEYHCTDPVTSLEITGFAAGTEGKAEQWSIVFTAGDTITVTLPDTVIWAVAEPVFTPGSTYWMSIVPLGAQYLAVWTEVATDESASA